LSWQDRKGIVLPGNYETDLKSAILVFRLTEINPGKANKQQKQKLENTSKNQLLPNKSKPIQFKVHRGNG